MARIFDIIELPDEMAGDIVRRFPEQGSGTSASALRLIVRESQVAVFFRDGKALDVFGPGRHTIATANIPLLVNLIGKAFSDRTPFTAEVYFVSRGSSWTLKWGTPEPHHHPGRRPADGPSAGLRDVCHAGRRAATLRQPDRRRAALYRTADIERFCAASSLPN